MSRSLLRRARRRAHVAVAAALLAGGLVPGMVGSPAGAATVTLSADADAYVAQSKPKNNYGTQSKLSTDASPAEEAYVRFQVAGIGPAGSVTRAVVRLYASDGASNGPAIYRAADGWEERGITWNTKPARDAGAVADLAEVRARAYVDIDVSSVITGDGTYSFALVTPSSDRTQFASREASSNKPQLVLTTPFEPTTTTTRSSPPPPPPAGTVTKVFDPTADAKVAQETPGSNFGATTALETDAVPVVESFIRFSTSGITGTVRKAVLRGYVVNGSPNGPAIYSSGTGWTESGITWSNKPNRSGGAIDDKGSVSAGTWVEWNVTPAVGTADATYSFNLATDSNDGADISSREASSNKPQLVVTFDGESSDDTTPPDTVIEEGPSGTVPVDTATFRFFATEGSSVFACRLDGGSWTAGCTSPHTLNGLSNGNHTFEVRATDPAGNTDLSPASRTFSVAAVNIRDALLAPASGAHFGAHVQAADRTEPVVSAAVGQVEAAIERPLAIDMWYEPWPNVFPTWREEWNFAAGRIPMISWGKHYTDQIAAGQHDAYIRARARGIGALDQPVMIRWFWEMDGSRNVEYAISPTMYIAAWQRIVTIFRQEGATNAAWVWCPNASGFNDGAAQPWYPGDAYVDWLCADGYNFYPERDDNRSFETTFASFYEWSRQRPKPIVIGEYGVLKAGPGERAAWLDAARATLKTKMTRVLGIVYFHSVHEHDWTLLDEPSAVDAFRRMAWDPYFNPPSS